MPSSHGRLAGIARRERYIPPPASQQYLVKSLVKKVTVCKGHFSPSQLLTSATLHVRNLSQPVSFLFFHTFTYLKRFIFWTVRPTTESFCCWISRIELFETRSHANRFRWTIFFDEKTPKQEKTKTKPTKKNKYQKIWKKNRKPRSTVVVFNFFGGSTGCLFHLFLRVVEAQHTFPFSRSEKHSCASRGSTNCAFDGSTSCAFVGLLVEAN